MLERLTPHQLQRLRRVFEQLEEPSIEFFFSYRPKTTLELPSNERREGEIAVLMPHQYIYERYGRPVHDKYNEWLDPKARITYSLRGTINFFPNIPNDRMHRNFSPNLQYGVSQLSGHGVDEEKLQAFERFAQCISLEWEEYQIITGQKSQSAISA